MICGYARVWTDGQSFTTQVEALTAAGESRVFRETATGANTDRRQPHRVIDQLATGDPSFVTRLDRLAHSTRDLLHTLDEIAEKCASFRNLANTCTDTSTATRDLS